MKNTLIILALLLFVLSNLHSQTPEAINYQAVLRNDDGTLVQNESATVQFEILDGNSTIVYSEEQNLLSNSYGLVNTKIGSGTVTSGNFSNIDWSTGTYNLKVKVDLGNGLIDIGESQLVSVPYALHAKTAENTFSGNWTDIVGAPTGLDDGDDVNDADADPNNEIQTISRSNDTVYLSNGGYVVLPSGTVDTDDQTLTLNGVDLSIVDGNTISFTGWDTNSSDDFSGEWSDINNIPAAFLDGDDVGITTESDPVFTASPASGISNANITDWNNDLDGDTTNELQVLSISNDTIFLTDGQYVKLPTDVGEFLRSNGIVHNTSDLANDNFVFGSTTLDNINGVDYNNRFFYNKELGAFRAGGTDTVLWDFDSLGTYSIGLGRNNIAKGYAAFASGWGTKAYGSHSSALGYFTQAIGATATALGRSTIARGDRSTSIGWGSESDGSTSIAAGYFCKSIGSISIAMGHLSESRGLHSVAIGDAAVADGAKATAIGSNLSAPSYGELSVGIFNTDYTPGSSTSFNSSDRLFTVGNGVNGANRSNALTILKSGNTGIGVETPARNLHISDVMRIEPTSSAPANPSEGDIYMNSTTHKLMVYDGTVWQACW